MRSIFTKTGRQRVVVESTLNPRFIDYLLNEFELLPNAAARRSMFVTIGLNRTSLPGRPQRTRHPRRGLRLMASNPDAPNTGTRAALHIAARSTSIPQAVDCDLAEISARSDTASNSDSCDRLATDALQFSHNRRRVGSGTTKSKPAASRLTRRRA